MHAARGRGEPHTSKMGLPVTEAPCDLDQQRCNVQAEQWWSVDVRSSPVIPR